MLGTFLSSDPPHIVYSAHLTLISHLLIAPYNTSAPNSLRPSSHNPLQESRTALSAIRTFEALSIKNGHPKVTLLANTLYLRTLVSSGLWSEVEQSLAIVEAALGLSVSNDCNKAETTTESGGAEAPIAPSIVKDTALKSLNLNDPQALPPSPTSPVKRSRSSGGGSRQKLPQPAQQVRPMKEFQDPFEASMAIHTLIIGVVYYTFTGHEKDITPRLTHLHYLLDSGVLKNAGSGVVEVSRSLCFSKADPNDLFFIL